MKRPIKRKGSMQRVLVVVLVLIIILAVAEFGFFQRAHSNAIATLDGYAKATTGEPPTRAALIKEIGASIESKFTTSDMSTEEKKSIRIQRKDAYRWTRLNPFQQSQKIYVVYDVTVDGDEVDSVDPATIADDKWVFRNYYEAGNAPMEVTVQAKKRPVEETLFEAMDEDWDQHLSGIEISPESSMLKQMDLFDPNGDKKISRQEFLDAIRKLEEKKGEKLTQKELYGLVGGQSPGM